VCCSFGVAGLEWYPCSDVCWSFGVVGLEWYPCYRLLFHFLSAQHVSDINIHHQELATILLNYHIGRIVLGSMCVGVSVWLG